MPSDAASAGVCRSYPYDPNEFRETDKNGKLGSYDFTKALGYDEQIVRHNLNKVKRPKTAIIKAPALHKSVIIVEKPNYVESNMTGMR